MKRLCPINDNVVVRRDQTTNITKGGIVLPDGAKRELNMGRVLSVGTGTLTSKGVRVPVPFGMGAHILFDDYAGTDVEVDGETIMVMPLKEVWAVLGDC